MHASEYCFIFPPSLPVSPTTLRSLAFAATAAYKIFLELPDVVIARKTSPSLQ